MKAFFFCFIGENNEIIQKNIVHNMLEMEIT